MRLLLWVCVALCVIMAGCCSLSELERKALTVHQEQHPGMWKHPLPWEKGSWDTCPLRHIAMCTVTGVPLVLTATVWNAPYWDHQIDFWGNRHKWKCPEGKDCTCDQVIGEQ